MQPASQKHAVLRLLLTVAPIDRQVLFLPWQHVTRPPPPPRRPPPHPTRTVTPRRPTAGGAHATPANNIHATNSNTVDMPTVGRRLSKTSKIHRAPVIRNDVTTGRRRSAASVTCYSNKPYVRCLRCQPRKNNQQQSAKIMFSNAIDKIEITIYRQQSTKTRPAHEQTTAAHPQFSVLTSRDGTR